jgi:transcriptional regulator with XRE-family HTH domain
MKFAEGRTVRPPCQAQRSYAEVVSSHAPDHARVIPLPASGSGEPESRDTGPRDWEGKDREPLWRHIVGDVLRRERLAQERKLKDVAEAARISMPYLSEIERGRKEASSEVLAAAAHALGLGLSDLLGLAQDELTRIAQARRARAGARFLGESGRDGAVPPVGQHLAQRQRAPSPRAGLGVPRVEMSLAA